MADEPQNKPNSKEGASQRQQPSTLHDRYVVQAAMPLSDLDTPSARAYATRDGQDPGRALFALLVEPDMPIRFDVLKALSGHPVNGLMPMVDWGPIFWTAFGRRTMCVVYERPLGGRMMESPFVDGEHLNEYDIPRKIIQPMHIALGEIEALKISHRAIRPDNMFYMDAERQHLVLGDCASTPPGFDQPAIFEPVARGLASPHGRGPGTVASDYYALGVSLVFLTLGSNPIAAMKDEDMLCKKLELGSYAAMSGNARVPVSVLEPIRGMLTDVVTDRWGSEELDMWLIGKRNTPIQGKPGERADIAFEFHKRKFHTIQGLAVYLSRHVTDAAKVFRDGTLAAWARRHLEKPDIAELIAKAVEEANANASNMKGTNEYLVAKVCCLLDPKAPIRYKGIAVFPDGFGPFMAFEMCRKNNAQLAAELIMSELPAIWVGGRNVFGAEFSNLAKTFDSLRGFLKIKDPGYGIERCLYALNPGLPCQSQLIVKDYVGEIRELLPHLDQTANRVDTKAKPMDRHIIAFIATRFDQDIDPYLRALANAKEDTALIGMLSLLALLQWRLHTHQSLFGLTSWIGGLLGPAINTYHSRATRREIEREIPKLVRRGSLPDLFNLIGNAEKRRVDREDFLNAKARYLAAETEVKEIENDTESLARQNELKAQKSAATASLAIMLTMIGIFMLLQAH